MGVKIVVLWVMVLSLTGTTVHGSSQDSSEESGESSEGHYSFSWTVRHKSNKFGHQESREGEDTQGQYYVLLPDGRLQKVTFTVTGDSGYQPVVSYVGEAFLPDLEEEESDESDESEENELPNRNFF
ncbi:pro-resilin-like [Cherax quadricarinatus]|uniref:pro-resilin-like n=1 Tax=Cherax quadricarinatus TaxID=27406 RepID=UPI002378FD8E|nr:pro-resilin-like [Cherax quadricarinatus]